MLWSQPELGEWHLVELFSGQGQVSAAFRECGFRVASYDMLQHEKSMDFLSNGGYAF